MDNPTVFKDKTLMITGGTGSFGNTVLKHFMNTDLAEIRIFSRDEKKQDDMRHRLQDEVPGTRLQGALLHRRRPQRPERARRHARG